MSDLPHAINLTHDGTLILRIPKGYNVDKVVVEEMGAENRKKFVHMPANLSDYCDELWKKAYERGKAEGQAEIIRCKDCKHWAIGYTTKNYPNPYICELHSFLHGFERSALPEDYCSWAELRGEVNG